MPLVPIRFIRTFTSVLFVSLQVFLTAIGEPLLGDTTVSVGADNHEVAQEVDVTKRDCAADETAEALHPVASGVLKALPFCPSLEYCLFDLPDYKPEVRRIILAMEFPPSGADIQNQHANRTGHFLVSWVGHENMDWVDLMPYAPTGTNGTLARDTMLEWLLQDANDSWVKDWLKRIGGRAAKAQEAGHEWNLAYLGGRITQPVWEKYCGKLADLESCGFKVYRDTQRQLAIVARRHPSAHFYRPAEIDEYKVCAGVVLYGDRTNAHTHVSHAKTLTARSHQFF